MMRTGLGCADLDLDNEHCFSLPLLIYVNAGVRVDDQKPPVKVGHFSRVIIAERGRTAGRTVL